MSRPLPWSKFRLAFGTGFKLSLRKHFSLHLNSEPFQFDAPDEERIAPDDPRVPYRWS